MKRLLSTLLLLGAYATMNAQISYGIAEVPWPESFGNHRAILQVDQAGDQFYLNLQWRRHDPDAAKKEFFSF